MSENAIRKQVERAVEILRFPDEVPERCRIARRIAAAVVIADALEMLLDMTPDATPKEKKK